MNFGSYMKTSSNRGIYAHQNPGIRLLDWSDAAVSSRYGLLPIPKRAKSPALRIVPAEREDLFKYAVAAKAGTAFWELLIFTAMGLSALSALAIAFSGI
jgi:hypothetical protein